MEKIVKKIQTPKLTQILGGKYYSITIPAKFANSEEGQEIFHLDCAIFQVLVDEEKKRLIYQLIN